MEKHIHNINKEKVEMIKEVESDVIEQMAILFKMFADATRLKIMQVLQNNELNVCEIAYLLNMTHSAISHQLATLKMMNLLKSKKVGKEVFYSLKDEHISLLLSIGKEHILEDR
ncbi:MAG: metalloregulator ArsR/SmtB family transcription factor [Erysipelotrichaceae bacterium]|nr:metalloregulator ArsR/SmtB family transcription factor [Erysipelotrichaceae bacterium]